MRIEESVAVDAPAERVWQLIEDPAGLNGLDSGLSIEADPETPRPGLHTRYRVLFAIGPVPIGATIEVVELTPGRELAWTSLTGIDHRFRFMLRESGTGSRLILRFGYSSPGPFGLLAELASYGRVRAMLRRLLLAVKEKAERAPARRTVRRRGGGATGTSPSPPRTARR
jgi:uncharacterized protein YndB with AHSA1/START domain